MESTSVVVDMAFSHTHTKKRLKVANIGGYFTQVVVVADAGTDNLVVSDIQTYFCHSDDDTRAGNKVTMQQGASCTNQRI